MVYRRREISLLAHMHHPRVVQFLGACTIGEPWLIVQEYCPGGTLLSEVKKSRGKLPFSNVVRWSLLCSQGLRYLHDHKPRPVIHRDLKPSNILMVADEPKIADFGAARMLDNRHMVNGGLASPGGLDQGSDAQNHPGGSYRYMAPEIFRGEPYSVKVSFHSFSLSPFVIAACTDPPTPTLLTFFAFSLTYSPWAMLCTLLPLVKHLWLILHLWKLREPQPVHHSSPPFLHI